ncbi:MAG: sigma-54 dependent transcriptional regulator [Myxococcota bacterium]|nr:sigma-54 dependent transcriptional regulator [Myxococcota bacterium]
MKRVLVIEDDPLIRSNVSELLDAEGYAVDEAADGKAGIASALARVPDVVVCDIMMPVMDGHRVLRALRDYPETAAVPFIFLTARAEREDVRAGMSLGADDYVTKPFTRRELLDAIEARIERKAQLLAAHAPAPEPDVEGPGRPIVRSTRLRAVYERALKAAQTHLSILLLGETGVGKDVLAHAIHKASPRRDGPFVPLHCAAMAESLLESELFGHERGAFTGATGDKPGLFEAADGGTVFLDEIGELPGSVQVKLLRVLEDRRVRRVGGREAKDVDVRFVSATNRDLEAEVEAGRFRQDLYFRVGGLTLEVPPLRERVEEIAPLTERFTHHAWHQLRRPRAPTWSPAALDALAAHDWPGNVRELRNVVEQCVALLDGDEVRPEHLPARLARRASSPAPAPERPRSKMEHLEARMRELDRQRIVEALEACGGNQTRAAKMLGISRRTLVNRLDAYDLPRPRK